MKTINKFFNELVLRQSSHFLLIIHSSMLRLKFQKKVAAICERTNILRTNKNQAAVLLAIENLNKTENMISIYPCRIFLLVLAAKCSNAYYPSCECTDFVNDAGFGNCTGFSKFSFHGSLIACFVQLPSSCKDLINSTAYPGKQISVQACQERKSKN